VRRRDFITLVGGAAAGWPLVARAQQAQPTKRIGILMPVAEDDSEYQKRLKAFVQALRELGWIDGDNVRIDYRWGASNVDRIRRAATELIAVKPDAILASSVLAVAPLQQATGTIPIVFLQIGDPVSAGLVASLARPSGNLTGFASIEFLVSAKQLALLKQVAPSVNRVGVIYNPVQPPQIGMLAAIQGAAPPLNVQVSPLRAGNADEISHAIEDFVGKRDSGMIVLPNPVTEGNLSLITSLLSRYRVPSIYSYAIFVREGGLMSYGADVIDQYRQAASYVDKILKGAQPAELPVQQPTKYLLSVNLKTAKALGLTIPQPLLVGADEVVE
jgi:putative ABC transport system substrate-binding protein